MSASTRALTTHGTTKGAPISTILHAHDVQALLDDGERRGYVEADEIQALADLYELGAAELEQLTDALEERDVEVRADADRDQATSDRPLDDRAAGERGLAAALPVRDRPLPAAHRRGRGRARQAHRARRFRGQGADDQLEPPPRRLDREALPRERYALPRPDSGGRDRPQPRGREVRPPQGLQVLDVRHLVDPPGGAARDRRSVADDPRADPRPRAPRRSWRAPAREARGRARPRRDRTRSSRRRRGLSLQHVEEALERRRGERCR